jgi:hypothetical protein
MLIVFLPGLQSIWFFHYQITSCAFQTQLTFTDEWITLDASHARQNKSRTRSKLLEGNAEQSPTHLPQCRLKGAAKDLLSQFPLTLGDRVKQRAELAAAIAFTADAIANLPSI